MACRYCEPDKGIYIGHQLIDFRRASLSQLSNRVASLETERKNMRQMMDDFRLELEAFGQNMRDTEVRSAALMRPVR